MYRFASFFAQFTRLESNKGSTYYGVSTEITVYYLTWQIFVQRTITIEIGIFRGESYFSDGCWCCDEQRKRKFEVLLLSNWFYLHMHELFHTLQLYAFMRIFDSLILEFCYNLLLLQDYRTFLNHKPASEKKPSILIIK